MMNHDSYKHNDRPTAPARSDSGFTLIELAIATALSVFMMGVVFMLQGTAQSGFSSSVAESRMSQQGREGIGAVRNELRSVLTDSIVTSDWTAAELSPVLRFQTAVSFDSANGTTNWGGGEVVDGFVEYATRGTELVRLVKNAGGVIVEEKILLDNLDTTLVNGLPVIFFWDEDPQVLRIQMRTMMLQKELQVRRQISTVIHVDSVYKF